MRKPQSRLNTDFSKHDFARRALPLALITVLSAGCESGPLKGIKIFEEKPPSAIVESVAPAPISPEQWLVEGVRQYEDGAHKEAMQNLQTALDNGLTLESDQVKAHKYLAFIHCASAREKQCREEFIKILEIYPKFELDPAEAGHPVWKRVFRSTKKGLTQKKQ